MGIRLKSFEQSFMLEEMPPYLNTVDCKFKLLHYTQNISSIQILFAHRNDQNLERVHKIIEHKISM